MSLLRLQHMIDEGKTWYYRNKPIILKRVTQEHNEIQILVEIDGKPQKFIKENEEKLDLFLNCFKEVPVIEDERDSSRQGASLPDISTVNRNPAIYTETKAQFQSLTQMLIDDIKKVREDPQYVHQAKQVCNNVSAIVNVTRLQLQLLKNG